ncbi:LysR family transcriptional regulator [Microbulbifer pacificus]|uniref:LysR family transcriptional regulator n=1 Tax=Microbulbifer pacificus TaxID=407164 RepID=A0AAU0N2G5_9GAMM|nr:LysR family transcriptional regulator [Microbulbifer pacificus]WOX07001.1 LysR family transcriptional regulator [Microbulbifer pacificus]
MDITFTQGVPHISLRHLKAMLYVARHKNLTRAAAVLNRSQTTITKAIGELETQLGLPLFERTPGGMLPTRYGDCLASWVALAEAEFLNAGRIYRDYRNSSADASNLPIFSMTISYKRLASFIALYDHRDVRVASEQLEVTPAAVSGAVRQIEDLLELSLFERGPGSTDCTPFCEHLARHIKLAFAQLRHGLDELASLDGNVRGSVAIGTLPYTRTVLIPRAINRLLATYPELQVSTSEGRYTQLEVALRSGDLDCIVGATRPAIDDKGLCGETLLEDQLAIIVRCGHPLIRRSNLTLADLMDYRWILPARHTPAHFLFRQLLQEHTLPEPHKSVETSSLSTVRGLLLESDSVALLSEHQIYFEQQSGVLTVLPVALEKTSRPIGVTTRAHARLSPATELFLRELRAVAAEFPDAMPG